VNLELIGVLDNKRFRCILITGTTRGYPFGLGVIGHGQNPPTPLKMRFKRVLWINLTKLCKTRLNLVKTHLNGF